MRLDTEGAGPGLSRGRLALIAGGAVVVAAALFGAGFAVNALFFDDDSFGEPEAVVATATPVRTASRTAAASSTATRTPTPVAIVTPRPVASAPVVAPATPAPTATPTVEFTKQPAVEVVSVSPALGTHLEVASVDIAINVNYQAGRDSNVLAWELYYCAGPRDCNIYGSRMETGIVPGAAGNVTLGAPFPAGGNYLRPIVVCRYRVIIGHYLTPEAEWTSGTSPDERCQGDTGRASVTVTGVTPDIGSMVSDGEVVTAYVEYDALGANQLQVISRGDGCVVLGARTIDIERDSTGVQTIHITTSPPGEGTLREVEALLLDEGGVVKARYGFGGC